MRTELISPPFDASSYDAIVVDFDTYKASGDEDADVDLFDGDQWVNLWSAPKLTVMQGALQVRGGTSATDAQVRFDYNAFGAWWQVDEVRISGTHCRLSAGGKKTVPAVRDWALMILALSLVIIAVTNLARRHRSRY